MLDVDGPLASVLGMAPCARSALMSSARMHASANTVGIARATVTRNTARLDNKYPNVPITAAATPAPMEAKRALRPNRWLITDRPTRPRLMAAIYGPKTQLLAAWSSAADRTTGKIGKTAYANALTPISATARPATNRS